MQLQTQRCNLKQFHSLIFFDYWSVLKISEKKLWYIGPCYLHQGVKNIGRWTQQQDGCWVCVECVCVLSVLSVYVIFYNNSQWDPIRVCARKIKCSWMHLLKIHFFMYINAVRWVKIDTLLGAYTKCIQFSEWSPSLNSVNVLVGQLTNNSVKK